MVVVDLVVPLDLAVAVQCLLGIVNSSNQHCHGDLLQLQLLFPLAWHQQSVSRNKLVLEVCLVLLAVLMSLDSHNSKVLLE